MVLFLLKRFDSLLILMLLPDTWLLFEFLRLFDRSLVLFDDADLSKCLLVDSLPELRGVVTFCLKGRVTSDFSERTFELRTIPG